MDPAIILPHMSTPSPARHRHLRRLGRITTPNVLFFVTFCTADRRPILANPTVFALVRDALGTGPKRYGWQTSRLVVMPDHVHLFCAPIGQTPHALSTFIGGIKKWTARQIVKAIHVNAPVWQHEFFDHLLRSDESYTEKAQYV